MRLAQRVRPCPACGRREPADARWCGDCGAPLAATGEPVALHLDDLEPDLEVELPVPRPARRWGAVGLVLALALGAGLVADPAVTGDPDLLGRLDDTTGRSSLLPPTDDLQLLWRRPVDQLPVTPAGPVRVQDLDGHVVLGEQVVDLGGNAGSVHLPTGAVPSADGTLVVADGDEVVTLDVRTGQVRSRRALRAADSWQPRGAAIGWVAGAAVLRDAAGVLGAVGTDGAVRWVGEASWTWTPAGDGTDWAVVTATADPVDRVLVVDGIDGSVHRDVGPAGVVHAPVVHGDTFAWVDPFSGLDRGLGHPVEVHGIRLDGSGRVWAVTDLPPTSGVPQAVRLTAGDAGIAVHHWTAGQATTAVWLDPVDGSRTGLVAVGGTGRTDEGWPVATVQDDVLAHVDPIRREIRVVDLGGVVRWSIPAGAGEGLVADGDVLVVRTPPRGTSLQSRLRVFDLDTGVLLRDRVSDDVERQTFAVTLADHVGVTSAPWPAAVGEHDWLHLDTGRRRSGGAIATAVVGDEVLGSGEAAVLGRVAEGATVSPVLRLPSGALVGSGEDGAATVQTLLAGGLPAGDAGVAATRADEAGRVVVGAAAVTLLDEDGARRWRVTTPVALRAEQTVLLDEVVVVVGWDGLARAHDRTDGTLRWTGPAGATAVTAGGDAVVLGTVLGDVVVLGTDGRELQRVRAGIGVVEDVAVVGGRVLVAVGDDVVALGRGAVFVEPGDRVEVP